MTRPPSTRDELVAFLAASPHFTNAKGERLGVEDAEIAADAVVEAGWRYDGSCRDCQANLDTNGGQHQFWCGTDEGKAQWPEEGDDRQSSDAG